MRLWQKKEQLEKRQLDFYAIGKSGTVEELHAANKQAVEHVTKPESFDRRKEFITHLGMEDQKTLRQGALDAFFEGRDENLLEMLLFSKEFAVCYGYVSHTAGFIDHYTRRLMEEIIGEIVRRSHQIDADIVNVLSSLPDELKDTKEEVLYLALNDVAGGKEGQIKNLVLSVLEKDISADIVQSALNSSLYHAVCASKPMLVIEALLDAGADANAALGDGYKGRILAKAIAKEASPDVIEILHRHGAGFADALYLMKSKPDEKWADDVKESLNIHAEKITGKRIEQETPSEKLMREIVELRDELTKTNNKLSQAQAEIKSLKSQKLKPRGGTYSKGG